MIRKGHHQECEKMATEWRRCLQITCLVRALYLGYTENSCNVINRENNPKMGKGLNRHLSKEDTKIADKHLKSCSTPLSLRETHTETPPLLPAEGLDSKGHMRGKRPLRHCQPLGHTVWWFHTRQRSTPRYAPKRTSTNIQTNTCK